MLLPGEVLRLLPKGASQTDDPRGNEIGGTARHCSTLRVYLRGGKIAERTSVIRDVQNGEHTFPGIASGPVDSKSGIDPSFRKDLSCNVPRLLLSVTHSIRALFYLRPTSTL